AEEELRAGRAALPDPPRAVRSWTARRLGVHPAISGRPGGDGKGFVLPRYVPRPHDLALWDHLHEVIAARDTTLVVLEGESCTGKTRTAFEAVSRVVPDDFDLFFPADASSLLAALAADALGPRSVLWLNEAQHCLTGPSGEAAAAALLRRLDDPGPLVVLATLWPDDAQGLTDPGRHRAEDPHRHARVLLSQAH
ncbi:sel1 repeat family protein, partial [Streptomyces sp. T21Q-yed]|nr:sel1 repeat family protein [Streptomyces sp. T21Q-yed]